MIVTGLTQRIIQKPMPQGEHRVIQPTTVYDTPEACLPAPGFAKDFNLTIEGLFRWLLD